MCIDLAYLVGVRGRRRLPSGCGHEAAPAPPPLGRSGGARLPSGCPLQTSPERIFRGYVRISSHLVTLHPITLSLPGLGCRNDLLKILLPGVAVLDRDPAH